MEHLVIDARTRDVGGFAVRRLLPFMKRRTVGPFIFFDHFGPHTFGPADDSDVLPHPHIGLATVTYLFEGAIDHRDSLGTTQRIEPGAINWMHAGRGIAHSERTPADLRGQPRAVHGIQSWFAVPTDDEQAPPSFVHTPASELPELEREGATIRVLAGTAYGERSPVPVPSPTLYVDASLPAGAELDLPAEHAEVAVYPVAGSIEIDGTTAQPGRMIVLAADQRPPVRATTPARLIVLGGAPLEGRRHIWWNFVSSRRERIERAKEDWRARRFPAIPGDDETFVPLPE